MSLKMQGFTLVELSIVIIIIGFLIAGISAGTSLIKQAALNSVITDLNDFHVAYNNFVSRFQGAPGDINTGGALFPTCSTTPANSLTYCSGNDDGLIANSEAHPAWKHLELAGMIHAGIQTVPASAWNTSRTETVGVTVPASKIDGAGYELLGGYTNVGFNNGAGFGAPTVDYNYNIVYIGKPGTQFGLATGALSPQGAFNIDQKIDDGNIDSLGQFLGALTGRFTSTRTSGNDIPSCVTTNYGNIYDISGAGTPCISGLAVNK